MSRADELARKGKTKERARSASVALDCDERPVKRQKTDPAIAKTVAYYDAPGAFQETPLYTKLHQLDNSDRLARYFKYARKLHTELGSCAADLLLRKAGKALGDDIPGPLRRAIEDWDYVLPSTTSHRRIVSSQLATFVEVLQSFDTQSSSFRGVVIVKRPATAVVMASILRLLDEELPHIRAAALPTSNIVGSPQDESVVLTSFKSGAHNLLITNRLGEKLDMPVAATIIHFNLLEDWHTPLLARTWADKDTSVREVYLAEHGDETHANILKGFFADMQSTIGSPDTSPAISNENRAVAIVEEEDGLDYVEEPVTGKRINAEVAPMALERYLSALRNLLSEDERPSTPWCRLDRSETHSCVLHLSLPKEADIPAPLRRLADENPQGARDQQCLSTCKQLLTAGLLRDEFFFTRRELGDADDSALDGHEVKQANHSTNTRCYLRKQPSFWTRALRTSSSRFYPLVVSIDPVDSFRDGPHAPMVILARLPLPALEAFPVFSNGEKAFVRFRLGAPFELDEKKREVLLRYTLRISRALTNKPLECTEENICYYLAPLDRKWDSSPSDLAPRQLPKVDRHISWHQVTEGAQRWATKLVPDGGILNEGVLEDCVIQDRAVEFTNRHYVLRLRRDLSPHSKMEPSPATAEPTTYLEYCKSRVKDFQGLKDESQPLIEVSLAPPVVDTLAPSSKAVPTVKNPARLLIPELCHKFVLPASVWRTALLIPSITHMMDRVLLAKEMKASYFGDAIGETDLLQAVTPVSANVEKDYERLELLGDTILKDVLSTYFFVTMPTKREGALNAARSQAVSNRTLHEHAIAAGLTPWIQSKPMVVKLWAPYILPQDDTAKKGAEGTPDGQRRGKQQRLQDEQGVQWIGDKTVADVVEAIIGAAFRHGGLDNALFVMKRLNFDLPEINGIVDFWRLHTANTPMSTTSSSLPAKESKAIETITGVESIAPALLAEALTHGSLSGHKAASYDRLEFLGDGILDFNVAWYIFQAYPHLSPGGLSLLKAAMVSNSTLAAVAVDSGLHEHIRCSSKEVASAIKLYAQKIIALRDQEYRDAEAEERLPNQFWLDLDAPKSLADLVEAIIGAIYVSDHFESHGVETFFEKVLRPFYDRHIRLHTLAAHPSKSLFELLQAEGCHQHAMRKTSLGKEVRSEVVVHNATIATAVEPTSNLSMRKAATAALDALSKDPEFLARTCDCKIQKAGSQSKKMPKKVHALGYEVGP